MHMKIMINLKLILIFLIMKEGCSNITSIGFYATKIMELLQLGKIDKGLVSKHGKYTFISSCWFRNKPNKENGYKYNKVQESGDVYIEHAILITTKYKRGKYDSIKFYRVLSIFRIYYNKWFIHMDS